MKHGCVLRTERELNIPTELWYLKVRGISRSRWVEDLIKTPWSRKRQIARPLGLFLRYLFGISSIVQIAQVWGGRSTQISLPQLGNRV